VKSSAGKGEPKSEENIFGGKPEKDADTKALEGDLSAGLRMKVLLNHKPGSEKGQMVINYGSLDDLDELCRRLGGA
jgi:ParB family chromosome partitioning protein